MEEKKRKSRYNQAQNKATQKYIKTHLDEVKFRIPKGRKDYYKAAAEACGTSLTQFIVTAMDEKIEREGVRVEAPGQEPDNQKEE